MLAVRLEGIRKSYKQGNQSLQALRDINLDIEQGAFVVIKGESGSGKSTLLNIIGCMDVPDGGQISIQGQAVQNLKDHQLTLIRRRHVGFVFQSFNLLPALTALENVEYPLYLNGVPERRKRAADALREVGLGEHLHKRPNQLSGGQAQRVAIARAMVNKPDLILADEPTANLDSKTSDTLVALMENLNHRHGLTFVMVTHGHHFPEHAQIVNIKDGIIDAT
ncbi:ABC transporter ATP-binding protein [Marinobacteraceae bacterium S3BR75-40.1]